VVMVEIAIGHLTPDNPLKPMERDQLRAAMERLEAYYGPVAGGPALLWGHFAVVVFWIGFPRYLAWTRAKREAAEAAAESEKGPGA